jgi:magnesium transporter
VAEPLALAQAFLEERPRSAARSLESLTPADAAALLELVPVRIAAPAVARMTSWAAARALAALPPERAAAFVEQLGSRDALPILRQMPVVAREPLLAELRTTTARHYRRSLTYSPFRVGAWINHDVASLGEDQTAGEALQTVIDRGHSDEAVVYVVDRSRRYLGSITLVALLHAGANTNLAALAQQRRTVSDTASLGAVSAEPSWSSSLTLPVTSSQGELLGELSRETLEKALNQNRQEEPTAVGPSVVFHLTETYVQVLGELVKAAPGLEPLSSARTQDRRAH